MTEVTPEALPEVVAAEENSAETVEAPVTEAPLEETTPEDVALIAEEEARLEAEESQVEASGETTVEAVDGQVDITNEVADKPVHELDTKSLGELQRLHDEAIVLEDAAKRELHVIRQRAANMASTVDDEIDKEVVLAKQKVADAITRLHEIEKRLIRVPRDIWGSIYGRSV